MAKGLCPPDLEQNTIPAVFNRAGYDTMRTCKTGQQLRGGQQALHRSGTTPPSAAARPRPAAPGMATGCWNTSRQRAGDEGHRPVPDLLRVLAPARHARRHARAAGEVRRGQSHRQGHVRRRRIPRRRSCPPTICPRIRSPTATPASATKSPSAACGSGATSGPSATSWAASSPAARTSTSRSAACSSSSRRWASSTTPTSSTPPTTASPSAATACRASRISTSTPGACPSSSRAPASSRARRAEGNIYLLDVLATLCDLAGISAARDQRGHQLQAGPRRQAAHRPRRALRRLQRRHQAGHAERQEGRLEADQVRRHGRQGARDPALQPGGESPTSSSSEHHDPASDRTDRPDARRRTRSTSPATRGTRPSSRRWRPCCSPRCAAWMIPGGCGTSPMTA